MTSRTSTDLLTNIFQDGQGPGAISASDMRDLIESVRNPFMGVYVSTPAATTISVAGTAVKMAGTTTVTSKTDDMDANAASNRVRYTGTVMRHFHVVAQATLTFVTGVNQNAVLQVYHFDASAGTGSLIVHSEARADIGGGDEFQVTTHADVMLDTNDYLEIWVANAANTNNMQAEEAYLFAMGMMH